MSKRRVWVASIGYEQFIVEPEDIGTVMYLVGRIQRCEGYPRRVSAADEPVCSSINFEEVEFGENEVEPVEPVEPAPPTPARLEPF